MRWLGVVLQGNSLGLLDDNLTVTFDFVHTFELTSIILLGSHHGQFLFVIIVLLHHLEFLGLCLLDLLTLFSGLLGSGFDELDGFSWR